jgi:hypothetical protein
MQNKFALSHSLHFYALYLMGFRVIVLYVLPDDGSDVNRSI